MRKIVIYCMLVIITDTFAGENRALKKMLDLNTDVSFGVFCDFIEVPHEQKESFGAYYKTQAKKIKRVKSNATRQARAQELRDKGRSALEVEEPKLYSEFTAFETGTVPCISPRACVAQNARLFLTRYGAWHEFKKSHAQSQASMWAKVKGFARDGKQRIAGWFAPREEIVAVN